MHSLRPLGTLRSYDPLHTLQLVRGYGPHVWDASGRRYLDMICGYSACNLGHSHPRLVSAAMEQLQTLAFANGGESPWRDALESRLAELWRASQSDKAQSDKAQGDKAQGDRAQGDRASDVKVWLSTTGARGVELAWRVASAVRPGGVARFDLGYHGR
jgi:4-aminobutyrate aminotransferase-like enzyme